MMRPICERLMVFKEDYGLSVKGENIEITKDLAKMYELDATEVESGAFNLKKYLFTEEVSGFDIMSIEVLHKNGELYEVFSPLTLDKRFSMDPKTQTFVLK